MFRFLDSQYLWLLWLVPVLVALALRAAWKRRRAMKVFAGQLGARLAPMTSHFRLRLKLGLCLLALTLLIVALARPQAGVRTTREKRQGIQAIICMDISNSMLATDVAPSRLDKSKMIVENLVDGFVDDKVGLVVFAGDAFVQLPVTSDYVSAKMFLDNIQPSLIQDQGTDIGKAITLALNSFDKSSSQGKAIILITDGEDHEGGAEEAARQAAKQGVKVYVLGVGGTSGAPIPIGDGNYLADQSGQTVMTKLNELMCRQLAQAGSGIYLHVDNTSDAGDKLTDEVKKLQKGEIDGYSYSNFAEQYQWFALAALLLLLADCCITEARNPRIRKWQLFKPQRGLTSKV